MLAEQLKINDRKKKDARMKRNSNLKRRTQEINRK